MGRWETFKRIYTDVPDHWGRVLFWIAFGLGAPAFMVWLALQLWWFWFWFRWFGVGAVILLTWMIVSVGFAAYRVATRAAQPPVAQAKPVDWIPWQHLDKYTISEFSKILAKSDPAILSFNPSASGYRKLLLDEAAGDHIETIARSLRRLGGRGTVEAPITDKTEITRDTAIKWADERKFDIRHIK
ncbi:MAG: hypothetical protein WDN08_08715 [Rhizomicrobium sp.]